LNSAISDYTHPLGMTLHTVAIGNITLRAMDYTASMTPYFIFRELAADNYKLNGRAIPDGGASVAIGANTGIVSIYMAKSVTLASIFVTHDLDRIRMLKMDAEGAEHEILAAANGELSRIDYLTLEAHFSNGLRAKGHTPQTLQQSLAPLIARRAVTVTATEVPG
jgi:hypothetical protein